jgi:hypothetical protein
MSCFYFSADLDVPASRAWRVVEAYAASRVHVFSAVHDERQEGDYRVVTGTDGRDVRELVVSTDRDTMRHTYTVPGLAGTQLYHATMQVLPLADGRAQLVWAIDFYPHGVLDDLRPAWEEMFTELVTAVTSLEP